MDKGASGRGRGRVDKGEGEGELPSNTIAGVFGIERTILFVLNDVCKFSTVHPVKEDEMCL